MPKHEQQALAARLRALTPEQIKQGLGALTLTGPRMGHILALLDKGMLGQHSYAAILGAMDKKYPLTNPKT